MRSHRRLFSVVFLFLPLSLGPRLCLAQRKPTPKGVTFAPAVVYKYPASYPKAIASGDFNDDGIPDLIAGDAFGGVYAKLGRGDGTFGHWRYVSYPGHYASALAVGRFDGKNLDALVNDDDDAWVLLGQGGGRFPGNTWLDSGGNFVVGFAVGDFNGDGNQDVAALVDIVGEQSESSEIYLYLGNGDGTFQAPQKLHVSALVPVAILAGDFNGDGKLDLAALGGDSGDYGGQVSLLLGDGNGRFGSPIHLRLPNDPAFAPQAMTLGDFNGDNALDLAVAFSNEDTNHTSFVRILLGNGDGTFCKGVRTPAGPDPTSIAIADFNGDGTLDLVLANAPCRLGCYSPGQISVLLGNGDGSFQPPAKFAIHGQQPMQLTVADFNGDGKPDVATINGDSQNVSVLLNTTQFPRPKTAKTPAGRH